MIDIVMMARWTILFLFYFILPFLQVWYYLEAIRAWSDSTTLLAAINYTVSLITPIWILNNLLLAIKLPVLQRLFPYDWRIRFHIVTSLGILVFIVYHFLYNLLSGHFIDGVSWTLAGVIGLLFLFATLWIPLPGVKSLRKRMLSLFRSRLMESYDFLKRIHNIFFISLAFLVFVHIKETGLFAILPPILSLLYQGHFLIALGLYLFYRMWLLFLPKLRVKDVYSSQGIVHLRCTPPRRLRYKAGQFAFLRFYRRELLGEEHPFSFLTAPHEQEVEFGIRTRGDFTQNLLSLKEGDRVRINSGFGNFYPLKNNHPLCFIASGIGVVPLISLLRNFSYHEKDREILCFFSVHNLEELPGRRQLEQACRQLKHLRFHLLQSQQGEKRLFYHEDFFRNEIKEHQRWDYYLCSSSKIRLMVIKALKSLGVSSKQIFYEEFSFG